MITADGEIYIVLHEGLRGAQVDGWGGGENNMSPRSPVGDFPREEDGSSGGERICFVAENVSVLLPPYLSPLSNFHSVEQHPEGPGQYKHVTSNKNLFQRRSSYQPFTQS